MDDMEIVVAFRAMAPTDEIVSAVRRTCKLVGDAIAERPRWHVVLERLADARTRVQLVAEAPRCRLVASQVHDDPMLALQHAFAALGPPHTGRPCTRPPAADVAA